MKSLLKVLMLTVLLVSFLAAQDLFLAGHVDFDPADTEDVRYGTSGHRGLTADADLDSDGKKEIYAAHYGHGGGVVGFEVTAEGVLELFWNSDTTTTEAAYSS